MGKDKNSKKDRKDKKRKRDKDDEEDYRKAKAEKLVSGEVSSLTSKVCCGMNGHAHSCTPSRLQDSSRHTRHL